MKVTLYKVLMLLIKFAYDWSGEKVVETLSKKGNLGSPPQIGKDLQILNLAICLHDALRKYL